MIETVYFYKRNDFGGVDAFETTIREAEESLDNAIEAFLTELEARGEK